MLGERSICGYFRVGRRKGTQGDANLDSSKN